MEDKEKFVKGVVGYAQFCFPLLETQPQTPFPISSRSLKRTRDAANQFTLVARGLEGSNFGYASVTM